MKYKQKWQSYKSFTLCW